jgi:hypothetical protein
LCTLHVLDLLTINFRATGTIIKVGSSAVEKKYTRGDRSDRVLHLRNIYQLLQDKCVLNVDSLLQYYINDHVHGSVVYLQPKGIDDTPRSGQEVLEAVLCVLEALVVRRYLFTMSQLWLTC